MMRARVMFKLELLASLLPHRVLRVLSVRVPLFRDPDDGWTFWLAASYRRWCRQDAEAEVERLRGHVEAAFAHAASGDARAAEAALTKALWPSDRAKRKLKGA